METYIWKNIFDEIIFSRKIIENELYSTLHRDI